jgi:hypothetical protein
MKQPGNYLILFLSVALLATGGLLWRKAQEAAQWQSRAVAGEAELATQAQAQADLAKRAEEAEAKVGQLQDELAAARLKPGPANARKTAKGKPAAPVTVDQEKQWLAEANDPAVMQRLNAQARLAMQQRYAGLFAKLGLTADQTEALTKLLSDKQLVLSDVAVSALQNGVDPHADPDAFQALVVTAKAGIEDQMRSLLGETGYAQYLAFTQDIVSSNTLVRVQRVLANTPDILTDDQTAQLKVLLSRTDGNGRITPRVIADAQAFLSPAQIQALQQANDIQQAASQSRAEAALPPADPGN